MLVTRTGRVGVLDGITVGWVWAGLRVVDLAHCGRGGGIGDSLDSLEGKSSGVAEGVRSLLADRYLSGDCSICCSLGDASGLGAAGCSALSVSSTSSPEASAWESSSATSARESLLETSGLSGSATSGLGSAGCSTWRDQEKGQMIA